MARKNTRKHPTTALISASQAFTAGWVDLGSVINTANWGTISFYLTVDINDTQNARFRILSSHTSGGTEYTNMILNSSTGTPGAYAILAEDEYVELGADSDQNVILQWDLSGLAPYIQLQISAGTAGASPGSVTAASYVLSDS